MSKLEELQRSAFSLKEEGGREEELRETITQIMDLMSGYEFARWIDWFYEIDNPAWR